MANISAKIALGQEVPFRNEELGSRNLAPSHPQIKDSQLGDYPCSIASNTTFNTFRAYGGQSGFLGEIGDRLQRQPSFFSSLPLPSRAPEELICLLGNKDGKLKSGATIQPPRASQNLLFHVTADSPIDATIVERAKPRPRVGLDIQLDGDTFVQGQTISGRLVVHVRDAKSPVRLANTKLRAIGFECLDDGPFFHVFFHYSCGIDDISYAGEQIFSESPENGDTEGYREARPGIHVLPFEMTLPEDPCFGKPKGVLDVPGGVSVRYIIMATVNIKDPDINKRSLSHFYRACSIWPSLSMHDALVPSTRPLVSTAVMTLSKGNSRGKLKLSARVPRLSYLSGQHCYVHIQVLNDTHKTVRALHLTLVRTTTVYRPQSGKGDRMDGHDHVSTSYQTKSFVDMIAESRLAVAGRTGRKCASSRGWWAGVGPQERTGFTHRIMIPPDALSFARTELLAVDHAIRVTICASGGTIGLTSQLSVTLPIRVLSMLSVDPSNMPTITHARGMDVINGLAFHLQNSSLVDSPPPYRTRPSSIEHPQESAELLPHYLPTPNAWISVPTDRSQIHEHASVETSLVVDESIHPTTVRGQRPAQTSEARAPILHLEEESSQHLAVSSNRPPRDAISHSQAGPGGSITSPTPSLCRARDRALMITGTSVFSRLGQSQPQGDIRNRDVPSYGHPSGAGRRDLCSYESPFSRRVKEKLRQVQANSEESPREPSRRIVELPPSSEHAERDCEREIREPTTYSQEQSYINTSSVEREAGLHRTKPLHVRTGKPKSLMGPRKLNVAPAPESVMDRVRVIERRNDDEAR